MQPFCYRYENEKELVQKKITKYMKMARNQNSNKLTIFVHSVTHFVMLQNCII